MAIKAKQSGAYADVVGVFAKASGTYSAVQGIYAKSGGAYESAFSGQTYPAQFFVNLSNPVNGVITDGQAVVTINYVGNLNPIVSPNRTSGVAPLSVVFDATSSQALSSLAQYPAHQCLYRWNFGDEDGTFWQQGILAGTASKNEAWGPVSAHVFWTSGTKTVTVEMFAWDASGNMQSDTATVTITVTNADTVFASDTVYVSDTTPTAGADGVPLGANVAAATTAAQFQTLAATYKRIFVRAGKTFNLGGQISLPTAAAHGGLFTRYGPGANPMFVMSTNNAPFFLNASSDWRFVDIDVNDNGTYGDTKTPFVFGACSNILVARSNILKCRIGYSAEDVNGLCLYECDTTGMYDDTGGREPGIGLFLSRVRNLAILGSNSYDSPTTHVARVQGVQGCVISHSRFAKAGPTRNALSIREWTTTGFDNGGQSSNRVYLSCNIVDNSERGGYALYVGPQSINHVGYLEDVIAESNYCVGKDLYPANFAVAHRLSVRSNLLVTQYSYAIGFGLGGNAAGSPASDNIWVSNNTAYKSDTSLSTAFSFASFTDAGLASEVYLSNNLVYAPGNNKDGATNGTQATLIALGGTSQGAENINYFLAANSTTTQINSVRPWASATPSTYAAYTPSVYGVGTGVVTNARADFFGETVTAPFDMGAIKV